MGGWCVPVGLDDRNDGDGPGECAGHAFELTAAHVEGYRLRQTRTCTGCGAVEYVPSVGDYAAGDVTYESRQPLFSRRAAHDDIG